MIPTSLSASSVQTLEACFARWIAENYLRSPQPSSSFADVGTAVHEALELFVKNRLYERHSAHYAELVAFYTDAYERLFSDKSFYDDGLVMIHDWWSRQDWTDRVVISTEKKDFFNIKADGHTVKFNYIWDRCDLIEGPHMAEGKQVIEVIDYKTIRRPVQPAELRNKIQARCYGLAAQVQYPETDKVWITFDLLRFQPVSVVFTREDNIATYRYLQRALRRVLAVAEDVDLKTLETLNPMCNWCIRKQDCDALTKHSNVGGVLGITDPAEAAARRFLLENQQSGIKAAIGDLDKFILSWCEENDTIEFETPELTVAATSRRTRTIDSERAKHVVGPGIIAEYGSLGVTATEKLLKDARLTDEQKADLKKLITPKYSEPSVKITPKNPID